MTKGIDVVDITVVNGEWHAEKPVIIINVATAQKAIEKGLATELLKQSVAALALSGKMVVYAAEAE